MIVLLYSPHIHRGAHLCADRGLRRSLLETMDVYGPHLTTPVIEDQIYPQLQVGGWAGGRLGSRAA